MTSPTSQHFIEILPATAVREQLGALAEILDVCDRDIEVSAVLIWIRDDAGLLVMMVTPVSLLFYSSGSQRLEPSNLFTFTVNSD